MMQSIVGANEQRSSPTLKTAELKLITTGDKVHVTCSLVDDALVFEGDIVIARHVEVMGAVIVGDRYRWPGAKVVYDIRADLPDTDRVTKAISEWEAKTKLRFKVRTTETDYVLFRPGGGCSSSVGRQGGVQFVTLGPGCTAGNAIHEIGHTIGLWHEQSRADRDEYVKIDWTNIDPEMRHNFNQHVTDGDDVGEYDFGSIMHYPPNAFAVDPAKPTIIPKKATTAPVGQRNQLSSGDISAAMAIYP